MGPIEHASLTKIITELGPATDFTDLPRDEKQAAYELWAAAQRYETKPERRRRRNHMKSKWALRHSQIRAAAKKRGKPQKHPTPRPLSARRLRANDRYCAQLEQDAFAGIHRGVAPPGELRWNGEVT